MKRFARRKGMIALSTLALAATASSCNTFSPFDNPTSDAQYLSAARACLDEGDFTCANEYYGKVSGSEADQANSELAFTMLNEQGITMENFLSDFVSYVAANSSTGAGTGMTKLAEKISASGTSGEARRLKVYNAFLQKDKITDTNLKAFVQFVTSLALAAEVLSEITPAGGTLSASLLASSPTTCKSQSDEQAALSDACTAPTGTRLTAAATSDIATTSPTGTDPTLDMLYYSIYYANDALSKLSASGKFGATAGTLNSILNLAGAPSSNALVEKFFRRNLIKYNVGE